MNHDNQFQKQEDTSEGEDDGFDTYVKRAQGLRSARGTGDGQALAWKERKVQGQKARFGTGAKRMSQNQAVEAKKVKRTAGAVTRRTEVYSGAGTKDKEDADQLKHSELQRELKWQRSFTNLIPQDDYFGGQSEIGNSSQQPMTRSKNDKNVHVADNSLKLVLQRQLGASRGSQTSSALSEARTRAKTGSGADFSLHQQDQSFVTVQKQGLPGHITERRFSDRLSTGSSNKLIKERISRIVPNLQGIIGQFSKAIGGNASSTHQNAHPAAKSSKPTQPCSEQKTQTGRRLTVGHLDRQGARTHRQAQPSYYDPNVNQPYLEPFPSLAFDPPQLTDQPPVDPLEEGALRHSSEETTLKRFNTSDSKTQTCNRDGEVPRIERRDSFLNCILEQKLNIQHRPSLPLKSRPFFEQMNRQQSFDYLNKAQDASDSQSPARSREASNGQDPREGDQNDAESRPSSFKLKYRTKDGQLMDIAGHNQQDDGIALASPIRNDCKRRFHFDEIDWDNPQKQLPNSNEINKEQKVKFQPADQKKLDQKNSKLLREGSKADDGGSHSSSFLVEDEQSSDANRSLPSDAEFSVVDEDDDEKSARSLDVHVPTLETESKLKYVNNHGCPFDQDRILQVIQDYRSRMHDQVESNDGSGGTSMFQSTMQSQRLTSADQGVQQSIYASALSGTGREDAGSEQPAFVSFRQGADDSDGNTSQMQSFEQGGSTMIQCLAVSTNTAENVALLRRQQQSLQSFIDALGQIKKILQEKKEAQDATENVKSSSAAGNSLVNPSQMMTKGSMAQAATVTNEVQRKTECDSILKCNASNSTASCNVSKFTS